jgi:predicted RNA-binding Zn-ribbon protein involved in translation (DUF1610 family)
MQGGHGPPFSGFDHRGATTLMKTCGKVVILSLGLALLLRAGAAVAGEGGTVSCSTPGCGYEQNIKIGGGKKSPSLTGYCRSTKQFVRVKLQSWKEYREIVPRSPECPEAIVPIYDGEDVAKIPCPKCGNLTLHYQRKLMFD